MATVALSACGSGGDASSSQPSQPSTTTPPPTTSENVPTKQATVYLATALACSKLDGGDATFTPLAVSGKGYTTTIQPVRDCKEETIFNSYVYRVPIPKSGKVQVTPGDQPTVALDARKLAQSGAATVYYGRFGAGDYRVTVINYRKTGDVTALH
jgi:hypothetical protein